ncbi:hypothetical protein [Streptacidiphilus albus]|uniref:hypothetical protein n=1 Tax=Streptacidiphilus albus TaxID=105425 RepID=UPI00054B1A2B|nr:hypothetical protein [Streptacidiphilus albus]
MDRDLAPAATAAPGTGTDSPNTDPATDSASGSAEAAEPPGAGGSHRTSINESGSFTTARCSCGWFAPARRSRDKSRRDAAAHTG